MQYFFLRMHRIRVVIILVIVALIVAAYWLMTASPKRPNVHHIKDRLYKGKSDNVLGSVKADMGHFGGRLGRNAFPKSPDGKASKDSQWKAYGKDKLISVSGEKGQIGRPLKDSVGQRFGEKHKPLHPGDNLPKMDDSMLQRNWKDLPKSAENPSKWKTSPSSDVKGKNKFGNLGGKDKNRFGRINPMDKNKFGVGARDRNKFGFDQKSQFSTTDSMVKNTQFGVVDKNKFGQDKFKLDQLQKDRFGKPGQMPQDRFGKQGQQPKDRFEKPGKMPQDGKMKPDQIKLSQNAENRNKMLDSQFALDRKQLQESLSKDRSNFKLMDGLAEALARKYGIADSVYHRNKKYENKPQPNVSPIPHRMGPAEGYILTTDKRPKAKFMPSIGNGHVATVVDSDTVLLNGLYNGVGNASSRARIPSTIAFEVTDFHPSIPHRRNYTMNMLEGIYTETISGEDFVIEKRSYAHRSIPNLLVSELDAFRWYKPGQTLLKLLMHNVRASASKDITLVESKCTVASECTYIHGEVNAYETPPTRPEAHIFYDPVPPRLDIPVVPVGQKGMRMRWIFTASIATNKQEAETSFKLVEELVGKNELLVQHRSAWMNLWGNGALSLDGNIPLSQAVFSAMYNTYSSLPTVDDPARPFFGLASTDLAHGNLESDYSGHIKSDQETWMFPNILFFHSDLAKLLIKSRERNQKMAQQNAKENKFNGAQYPAETAFSGIEVGPPESKYEIHPSGDIARAIMQYIYSTKDINFYAETAKKILLDACNFYQSRYDYDPAKRKYVFKDVISLDRKRGKVSNSLYTNTIAKIALSAPYILSSYLGLRSEHMKNWFAMANKTYVPYDEAKKYHPQDDGYKIDMKVRMPEALMLRYPLMQHISLDILRKDVSYYERMIDGPDTAWITLAIAWMELKDYESAWQKLRVTMMNVQRPFKVWTETPTGGAKNYLPLMGGFLQSIINGYGGFRTLPDRLEFDPVLPPQVKTMNFTSVDYMGSSFDIKVNENSIIISMTFTKASSPQYKITIYATGTTHIIKYHQPVLIARQKGAIFPIGSPKFVKKPVDDVVVEHNAKMGGVNQYPLNRQNLNMQQKLPGQVPRPAVLQQGQGYQNPQRMNQNFPNKPIQSLNQMKFDRQNNAEAPVVVDAVHRGPEERKLGLDEDAPIGKGPSYKDRTLGIKTDTQKDSAQSDQRFKDSQAGLPSKLKAPKGLDRNFQGGLAQPGFKDQARIQKFLNERKVQQGQADTNIDRPQSALQYNKLKKRAFEQKEQKVKSFKKRLRRQESMGL